MAYMASVAKTCDAVVTGGDGFRWEGRIATAIGKHELIGEMRKLHFQRVISGVIGAIQVESIVKKDPVEGEAKGLQLFYKTMIDNGLGEKSRMFEFALKHVKKHQIEVVQEFLAEIRVPIYMVTRGGSTGAEAAVKAFPQIQIRNFVSQQDVFSPSGKLKGVNITMPNRKAEVAVVEEMLAKDNIKLSNCMVADDSNIQLLRRGKISVTHEGTDKEIRDACGIVLTVPSRKMPWAGIGKAK